MKKLLRGILLLSTGLFSLTGQVQAEVAVIISPSSDKTLSQAEIANIFLGKDKSLQGIDLKDWNQTKLTFYKEITSKDEAQLKSYWSSLVFTGKGQPLKEFSSDSEIVQQVAAGNNVIGYVDAQAVTDAVKVLLTLQ
ncbi:MAG: phosphate ABC transporter substrate-binding protein [Pseudomonadales bacterium]|nr:phosphate ABC transporter substrate-binding protein [Pseudomonadales bacterium]